jgi:hypothetical protein
MIAGWIFVQDLARIFEIVRETQITASFASVNVRPRRNQH